MNTENWFRDGDVIMCPTGGLADCCDEKTAILMTAAPDMLSALRKAKAWIECDSDDSLDEHDQAIYNETMGAINAAIQKATQP